jgi:hypothetical protein
MGLFQERDIRFFFVSIGTSLGSTNTGLVSVKFVDPENNVLRTGSGFDLTAQVPHNIR